MRRSIHAVLWGLVAALASCRDPTAIELVISTGVACGDMKGTAIWANRASAEQLEPATVSSFCQPDGTIGTLVVVPTEKRDEAIRVRVVSAVGAPMDRCLAPREGDPCIVSRRRLNFLPNEVLRLPISQDYSCVGRPCGETETCTRGSCQSAEVDADACAERGQCDPGGQAGASGASGQGGAPPLLEVGPSRAYKSPCEAIAAAPEGAQIDIDAGTYVGSCEVTRSLSLRGTGERPVLVADGIPNQKGILAVAVSGSTLRVENLEFQGAVVPDNNGAGVRFQGKDLEVRGCVFRGNQLGILANSAGGKVVIESSEFVGSTQYAGAHISGALATTVRASWFHGAKAGTLLLVTGGDLELLGSRVASEGGAEAQLLKVFTGGKALVAGNLMQRSTASASALVSVCPEAGAGCGPDTRLVFVNNTLVDEAASPAYLEIGALASGPHSLANNLMFGPTTPLPAGANIEALANVQRPLADRAAYLADAAQLDFRLRPAAAAAIDQGAPISAYTTELLQYQHPLASTPRVTAGAQVDVGAYEAAP